MSEATSPPQASYDVIVVGAGAAGLATALRLARRRSVVLLCKTPLGSGAATAWAQGGIAAAIGDDDSPALHMHDTEEVGGGLNDHHVVEILAESAAPRIADLIALGACFDRRPDGALDLGREAAHSRRRILHAGGDATGREIHRALVAAIRASEVHVVEARVERLRLERGRVVGVTADHDGERLELAAAAVVLATGGCGHLFRYTTNPPESTGDGLALAARAGATLTDLEFVQFHPTALAVGADPMPLLTEALRGEGARLIDEQGNALMERHDPRGDLAPRDVISRRLFEHLADGGHAYLDARSIPDVAKHFPTVSAATERFGLDAQHDPLPIAPAAHFHMGGIDVDDHGRSSLRGLWACGEVASTGAHGANRLASNSLLEALVFGTRVGDDILAHTPRHHGTPKRLARDTHLASSPTSLASEEEWIAELRAIMSRDVGPIRAEAGLRHALQSIERFAEIPQATNMVLVARLIINAALQRRESRGCHQRSDYPVIDPRLAYRIHTPPLSHHEISP